MQSLLLSIFIACFAPKEDTKLTIEISNIQKPKGTVRIGVFKANSTFGSTYTKPDYGQMVAVRDTKSQWTVMNLPPGQYALALYHDLNDNVKLDRNFVGYPKEPYGFSNNYRPIFRGPSFRECAFEVREDGKTAIKIKLID
jgi:uncharacterized protein (DUF2141 family)